MSINLDLVIEAEDDFVDMKSGLISMQGISDSIRCVAESVLTDDVPERQNSKSSVRTSLKKSFKGSYGHTFSLDIYDDSLKKKLNKIGKTTLIELISYFISESLYKESECLSEKAQAVLDGLGNKAVKIVDKLRKSPLKNVHEITKKFNYDVKIHHRVSRDKKTIIANFDVESAALLEAKKCIDKINLKAAVTRLNINTGNGRLGVFGEDGTVAFGFNVRYEDVNLKLKKIVSRNLNYNNGVDGDERQYINIVASTIKLTDGRIVKYIVEKVYEG